jgi:sugar phosphate isomerase/epimerase
MYKALSPGAMGIKVGNLKEAIDVASAAGFEGVEFSIHEVADMVDRDGADTVRAMFSSAGLKPAGWGLPTDWRGDESKWQADLASLPRLAAVAKAIGCFRTMTWIMPCSNDRPMEENRKFHVERFQPVSKILADHGCSFGLEFIGPKTLRDSQTYPFIHTMEEMLDMCAEIGPNMGLLLDCWHWYTSGGTTDDIRDLCTPQNVVYVHVNDAPPGLPIDEQIDNKRALPGATGVIDIRGFLMTLEQIGYDGPVVPEPFGNPTTWAKQSLDAIWKTAGLG